MKATTRSTAFTHSDAAPDTPDRDILPDRLRGREAYRRHLGDSQKATMQAKRIERDRRVNFWLGWYDEQVRPLYERLAARAFR